MTVLPDMMPFNVNSSAGFNNGLNLTLNGRRLTDDVIDAEFNAPDRRGPEDRQRHQRLGLPDRLPVPRHAAAAADGPRLRLRRPLRPGRRAGRSSRHDCAGSGSRRARPVRDPRVIAPGIRSTTEHLDRDEPMNPRVFCLIGAATVALLVRPGIATGQEAEGGDRAASGGRRAAAAEAAAARRAAAGRRRPARLHVQHRPGDRLLRAASRRSTRTTADGLARLGECYLVDAQQGGGADRYEQAEAVLRRALEVNPLLTKARGPARRRPERPAPLRRGPRAGPRGRPSATRST